MDFLGPNISMENCVQVCLEIVTEDRRVWKRRRQGVADREAGLHWWPESMPWGLSSRGAFQSYRDLRQGPRTLYLYLLLPVALEHPLGKCVLVETDLYP